MSLGLLMLTLALTPVTEPVGISGRGPREAAALGTAEPPATVEGAAEQVSPIGSFTYSLPIRVPAFHGLEPSVALDYDSARGNGEVGVGWRLRAGSSIVRSGAGGALPRYDDGDMFLLDGQELVRCTPGCATGGTHETRVQSHERFVFDGESWSRWSRDGVRIRYTAQPDGPGAEAFQWSVVDQTDPHGNVVRFEWDCPNECLVTLITYAAQTENCGGAGQDPCKSGAAIRFHYELRPDVVSYPTGRATRQIRQRLRTIEVRMDDELVAAHRLGYEISPTTGNSLLRTVQHFPSDATVSADGVVTAGSTPPLPPITFTTGSAGQPAPKWTAGTIPAATTLSTLPGAASYPETSSTLPGNIRKVPPDFGPEDLRTSPIYGDFDGDYRMDAASWLVLLSGCSTVHVRLAAHTSADTVKTPGAGCEPGGIVTDLNGDGADDLVTLTKTGAVRRLLSDRDGTFTEQPPGTDPPWTGEDVPRRCAAGDVNADHLGDIVCLYGTATTGQRVGIMRSAPDGGYGTTDAPLPAQVPSLTFAALALGDVDNSRTSDVMLAFSSPGLSGPFVLLTGFTGADGAVGSWEATPTTWSTFPGVNAWDLVPADVDGDARADYVLVDEQAVLVGLSRKGAAPPVVPLAQVTPAGKNVVVADADGDGRADLLTGEPPRVQRSNGDGTFAEAKEVSATPVASCATTQGCVTSAADANGDGQADLLFATVELQAGRPSSFKLRVQPSPVAPPAHHRWSSFDHNGDGRQDLFAVHYRNPGYQLYVLTAKPGGGYQPEIPFSILPEVNGPALDNPDAGGWLAMDVTGAQGAPDGRSDLVLADRASDALQIVTLVATDSGWVVQSCTGTACLTGNDVPDATDLRAWRPGRLDGDDRADLVRFVPLGSGVRVEYLLARADGWSAGRHDYFTSGTASDGGPLTRTDTRTFRTADLNRDGRDDFVHVETGGTATAPRYIIRSLLSAGAATWHEEQHRRLRSLASAAAHGLRAIDLDGDGVTDLGRSELWNGCLVVTGFLRQGEEWTSVDSVPAAAPCQPAAGLADLGNVRLDDVNGDGRTDALHLSRMGLGASATTEVTTLLNPGDLNRPWRRPANEPSLAVAGPDAWAWQQLDADSDGSGDLVRAEPGILRTLRFGSGADRLTSLDNGQGAATSVTYEAVPGARSYLPAGMLPVVVKSITVTDGAYVPPMRAEVRFTYDGARWSQARRQFAGFTEIRASRPEATTVIASEIGDACGTRAASVRVEHPDGGVMRKVTTTYDPPGAAAPYVCRPSSITTARCERSTACLEKTDTYTYDAYGNAELVEQSSGPIKRRIRARVRPNVADYIVNRPYERTILVPDPAAPSGWMTKAQSLLGYDEHNWQLPPGQHDDLTSVTEISDLGKGEENTTTYGYDVVGNALWRRSPTGVTAWANFDPKRSLFQTQTCDAHACATSKWDESLGVITTAVDANNQTTQFDHDAYGRPTLVTNPDGGTVATRYLNLGTVSGPDTARQRIRTEVSDGSPDDGIHWREDLFDGLGRTYRTRAEGVIPDPEASLITETRYAGPSDRAAATAAPRRADEPARWTTLTYDSLHRPLRITHPGSPASGLSRSYTVGTVEERDEAERLLVWKHDGFGRTVTVDERVRPCPDCEAEVQRTAYTYDESDRLLTITNAAGMVTTIARDDAGREISMTDPDRGNRTMTWYPDGSLKTQTDANGLHEWTYDTLGRPQARTDTHPITGTAKASWAYDTDPATGQPQGFSMHRPTLTTYITGNVVSGSDRFWYDKMGRVQRDRHCVDTVCQEMWYGYDRAGRLDYLHYPVPGNPDGELVKHTYDPAGRLRSVGGYVTGIEHDAGGATTHQTYGNGLHEQRVYNPDRGWLDSQSLAKDPSQKQLIYSATYQHGVDARVIGAQTMNPSLGGPPVTFETFHYDDLGRLDSYTTNDPSSLLPQKFTYDALGRITASPNGGTHHYDDPRHPHAVTSTSAGHIRAYDEAGNLRLLSNPGGKQTAIEWMPLGMPQTITTASATTTMAYNADNQRVRRTTPADTTYYLSRYLEQSGTGLTRYYWAGDELVARRDPSGKVTYPLQDRLGSVRLVTDSTGAVAARYNYHPYGAEHPGNRADDTSRRWLGQHSEEENGLIYLSARFYDPELGSFTAPDSVVADVNRPQALNRYLYGEGDPVNTIDPSGHVPIRVELKKEQDARSMITSQWMYMHSDGCGDYFVQCYRATPGSFAPTSWPGERATYAAGSVSAKDCTSCIMEDNNIAAVSSDPSEWQSWPGQLSDPPLIEAKGQVIEMDPIEIQGKITKAPDQAEAATNNRTKHANPSKFNPEAFLWASGTLPLIHFGPAEIETEVIVIAGINTEGPYYGAIVAGGGGVKGGGVHGTAFYGVETIAQYSWFGPGFTSEDTHIVLAEVSGAGFVGGLYGQNLTSAGSGVYLGGERDDVAAGVGFNFDWIQMVGQFASLRTSVWPH
ncbi:FG-GAP-like repeat-containing protein [Nonomuraea turcica]|uniref:FG-GAP-like repeat-containing protein n=1 Tax=Nonomuraea sp. G32 TaxID=3067274 RepID=UPI00273BCC0A|nr:FG-GAP-like repeat-containing protein [Nonomuraea sp. G32]MDP4510323.1 FG-GAP-like repeat-containing protein [Nonomuraea sp. G32]